MNQFSRVIFCSLNFFWGENFFLMFITISTSINTIYWETLLWDYSYKINFPLIFISEFKSSALLIKKININYCGIFDSLKYSVEEYISFTYIIQKYTQKKNILQLLVYAFWRQTILYYIFLYHIKKNNERWKINWLCGAVVSYWTANVLLKKYIKTYGILRVMENIFILGLSLC